MSKFYRLAAKPEPEMAGGIVLPPLGTVGGTLNYAVCCCQAKGPVPDCPHHGIKAMSASATASSTEAPAREHAPSAAPDGYLSRALRQKREWDALVAFKRDYRRKFGGI